MELKALVGRTLAPLLLSSATVVDVTAPGPRFRRLRLALDGPPRTPFAPGDKVQVLLPDAMRTYTPFAFDARVDERAFSLLLFAHGDTPASRFARSVVAGAPLRFMGPQASLPLSAHSGPAVLVGDETSLAVASALVTSRATGAGRVVLEVRDPDEVSGLLPGLGLDTCTTLVRRRDDDGHLDEVVDAVVADVASARVFLVGRAPAIHRVQRGLRARHIDVTKTRAYWTPGKRGLD